MKAPLLVLILAASAIACGDGRQNIPLRGCYCDDNARVRFNVLAVGRTYRLENHQRDTIDVTMLRGPVDSRLAPLPDGQSIVFVATGPVMEIRCRGHQGDRVRLELERIR